MSCWRFEMNLDTKNNSADLLKCVCEQLAANQVSSAADVLVRQWPFVCAQTPMRKVDPAFALRIFLRDGFIDRYSGARLVFSGTLRLISLLLPREFPFHPNWKLTASHPAYWHLSPTVDHLKPVASGGVASEENLVTTSMLRNAMKGMCSVEDLGWTVHPPGKLEAWDGLLQWFVDFVERRPELLRHSAIKRWHKLADRARQGSAVEREA
jgi:hypothetical protein